MAFSAIRIGAYETVKQKYVQISGAEGTLTLLGVRIAAGVTTGTIAILSAQPTDVVKIRMQAELIKPGEKSRYNGVMHAYKTVFKEEGIAGKVEKILKGNLNLVPSPSSSVKIQVMGGKVCLTCKGKTLLGVVNKLFVFKSLLTMLSNVLPLQLKQTFPPII